MFKKILIANRGEIALRIIRACKELYIPSAVVFSDADADSLPVRTADESVHIGPPLSRKSYLNMDNIIHAAKSIGAAAVHPGYGFLAENSAFAKRCRDVGLTFIGPSAETIAMAGNKSAARRRLKKEGISVIPGSDDAIESGEEAIDLAEAVGYPVIIKASGGGGGRGMRIAETREQLIEQFPMASGEAQAAFGNPEVYVEKYIEKPRHIEFQILADARGHTIHLGERECSIQKRYQKMQEESPSPLIDDSKRREMGHTAIRVAEAMGYTNAGTIEFLVDDAGNYYFMEVNARVQVEHPVTEMVTGIDIVQKQIQIAAGQPLELEQRDVHFKGWALECRINAEDPEDNFMPSPGTIENMNLPAGPGIRVDTHIYAGYTVPPFYDSLIAKLIVWAEDRQAVVKRMQRALTDFSITGISTNISFHQRILKQDRFLSGNIHTHFLETMTR